MKKKIKVLHVVSSYENSEGGPPIAVNNLAYSLRNSNLIENSLITTGIKKEKIKHFKKVSIGKLLLKKFYIPNLSTIFRLNKEIKENNLIHLHNFWNFIIFFGLFLSLLHNKKIILSPHGSFDNYNMNKSFLKKKIYLFFFGKNQINKIDKFHFLTYQEKKNSFFIKRNSNFILSNYCKKITSIPKLDLNKKKINFCYLGRLDKIKNIEYQLLIVRYLFEQKIGCVLNIIGPDFGEKKNLLNLVNKFKINNQVNFIKPIYNKRKYSWLKYSDFVLLTSKYECNSILALETMASGGLLLTNKFTNLQHLKKFGAIEILNNNIKSDCNKILNFYHNKNKLGSFKAKALEYTSKYNSQFYSIKISNFYSQLMQI